MKRGTTLEICSGPFEQDRPDAYSQVLLVLAAPVAGLGHQKASLVPHHVLQRPLFVLLKLLDSTGPVGAGSAALSLEGWSDGIRCVAVQKQWKVKLKTAFKIHKTFYIECKMIPENPTLVKLGWILLDLVEINILCSSCWRYHAYL